MTASPGTADPRVWVRVANEVVRRITLGEYRAGYPLPSQAALARELGADRETVSVALGYLLGQGVVTRRGVHLRYRAAGKFHYTPPAFASSGLPDMEPPGAGRGLWRGVASTVLSRVRTGQYSDRVPAMHALAAELGVSRGTVRQAYGELGRRGVLALASPRYGYRVCRPAARPDPQPPAGPAGMAPADVSTGTGGLAWTRAAAVIRAWIASGELPLGQLPPVACLAAELGVTWRTAERALRELAGAGDLECTRDGYYPKYYAVPLPAQAMAGVPSRVTLAGLAKQWDGRYSVDELGGARSPFRARPAAGQPRMLTSATPGALGVLIDADWEAHDET